MNHLRSVAPLTRRGTAAALLVLAALLAGCGGGGEPRGAATTSTPTPAGLTSFRYDLKQTSKGVLGAPPPGAEDPTIVIEVAGEVAGPRREHLTTKMSLGTSAVALERIEVEDRAWSRDVAGAWTEDRPGGTGGLAGIRLDPAVVLGQEANQRLRGALDGLASTPERVGSLDTLKYVLPSQKMRVVLGVAADAPVTSVGRIDADSTVWVTKDGALLVRLVTEAKPPAGGETRLELTLKDHNASGIKVEPPA